MAAMGLSLPLLSNPFSFSSSTAKNSDVFFASKQQRYGSIFKTHILGCPCVMMSSPEAAKLVLLTKSHLFKPIFPSSKDRMLGKQAIFFSRGQYHAKLRKLVLRAFMPDATVLTTLANSEITIVVILPNKLLASIAVDQSVADNWVQSNIIKFYPQTKIKAIAVGNEVFVDLKNTTNYLVPTMKNIHASLIKSKLDSAIKISSPLAFNALQNSYPSSAGSFKQELDEHVIKPMLDFLKQTVPSLSLQSSMALETESRSATPSTQVVRNAFVKQYYHILYNSPDLAHRFYHDSSVISRPDSNGVMTSVITMQVSSLLSLDVCFFGWF